MIRTPTRTPDDVPVLVLQHQTQDHAAWLAEWLAAEGVPFEVRNTEAGEDYPATLEGYRALAILGGEMSANDELPSLRQAERLIRDADARGRPVLGHCLGGQLIARAFGVRVIASPAPEIGWHRMRLTECPAARAWLGDEAEPLFFHWHSEAFELPPGAELLAGSEQCPHQAFALGPHLAMQFHVELNAVKLRAWAASREPGFLAAQQRHPTVHDGGRMLADAVQALPRQQRMADRIYRRWLASAPA